MGSVAFVHETNSAPVPYSTMELEISRKYKSQTTVFVSVLEFSLFLPILAVLIQKFFVLYGVQGVDKILEHPSLEYRS